MNYGILGLVFIGAIIFAYITGRNLSIHKKAQKMINECDFGDIVIDMSGVEQETFRIALNRNPKEMMSMNYILLQVKIRQ